MYKCMGATLRTLEYGSIPGIRPRPQHWQTTAGIHPACTCTVDDEKERMTGFNHDKLAFAITAKVCAAKF